MKKLIAFAFVLSVAGACGGSPSAPSQPVENAIFVATGNLVPMSCDALHNCDDFEFDITNNGPGCVQSIDLAGTITVTEDSGSVSSATWKLTLGSQAVGIIRPGTTVTGRRDTGSLVLSGNGHANVQFTKKTNVACN